VVEGWGYLKPGHEWDLIVFLGVVLLLFVAIAIFLAIKIGIKPTLAIFTRDLLPRWPRRRHGSQQESGTDDRRDNAGTGTESS
jgi:hypothetical protein